MAKKKQTKPTKTTLLIDADSLLYIHAAVNEKKYDWGNDIVSKVTDIDNAIEDFTASVEDIVEECKCEEYFLYFTGSTNFRYDVLPSYKGNRKGLEKPELFYELRDYVFANFPVKVSDKVEADDMVSILKSRKPDTTVIAAIDKDILKQVPGRHYNYKKDEWIETSHEEALKFFYQQVLQGDPTDGYKGCPGIGEVKAKAILAEAEGHIKQYNERFPEAIYWQYVVETYESKGLTEEDALVQARVAFMLTDKYWTGSEVVLWEPPISLRKEDDIDKK